MNRTCTRVWHWLRATFDVAYVLLVIAVLVLLAWNLRLTLGKRALALQLAQNSTGLSGQASPMQGDLLAAFATKDIAGASRRVSFDGAERRLLFIFSVQCAACRKEASHWKRIAKDAREHGVAVTWISIDKPDVAKRGARWFEAESVLLMPNLAVSRAYRVTAVPQVSLVSATGVVEWTHTGGMTEVERAELASQVSANAK